MIDELLAEREKTHGPYALHARITQQIKAVIWGAAIFSGNSRMLSHPQAEALDMIAHKIGRILAGDPNHEDHWRDIAGYATLVANELRVPDGEG